MQKSILSAAIVAGALAMSSGANASECGEISMADMNWPSATLNNSCTEYTCGHTPVET